MTKPLQSLLALFFLLLLQQARAQVSLISNNTNLTSGLVLPNGKPLLLNDNGMLWTTNGTTASQITTAVVYIDTAGAAIYNSLFYFAGKDAVTGDIELWATDGTAGGTKLIKNIAAAGSSVPNNFFVLNNSLYFTADDGNTGRELWKSNGSVGNATLVQDINATGDAFDNTASVFENNGTVYFTAADADSMGLWKIGASGTPALVKHAEGISLSLLDCAALGNKIVFTRRAGDFFTGTGQLWVSDGSTAGTVLLKDFGFGSSTFSPQLTSYNNILFFDGYDLAGTGIELWSTDGTVANTKLFKDINPGAGNSSIPLLFGAALINGKLYFNATTNANGSELWVTDGTAGNTKLFTDINTKSNGKGSSTPYFLLNLSAFSNSSNGSNGSNINFLQAYSTEYNGRWFFTADDGVHGAELWSTDGTAGNTKIVKDINTSGDGAVQGTSSFYTTSGIYFSADNGTDGAEPYATDGTDGGTKQVVNINTSGSKDSDPRYLFLYNSQLYLNAENGDTLGGNTDLYKIDKLLTVLPVNLLSFKVSLQAGDVALSWATAAETNTSRFEVERSTDGVHFNALGSVAAAGNSTITHQYQYTDGNVLQAGASTLYYRLRMIDKDGKFTYTATLPVQLQGSKFTIALSPNPVHNQLTVAFSASNAKNITLRVTDANGKPVYQRQFQTNGLSAMQQNIDVTRFAGGTYFVQLVSDKETKTATFVKQ